MTIPDVVSLNGKMVCIDSTDLERYRLWTQFFLQVNSCSDFGLCVDAIEVDAIIQDNGTQEQLQKNLNKSWYRPESVMMKNMFFQRNYVCIIHYQT